MKTKSGFTLVEILVSLVLGSLVMDAALQTFIFFTKSVVRVQNYTQMEQQTTLGLEILGRDVRMATGIESSGTPVNSITLTVPDEVGSSTYAVNYTYNAATRVLTRKEGTQTARPLISDISANTFAFIRYDVLQRVVQTDYPTNQLQVSFTLSPTTSGIVAQTSKTVISSRFVLRNR